MIRQALAAALVLAGVAGCAARHAATPAPEGLTATLDSPVDITLHWPDDAPGAAGRMVEFATQPGGPYTTLGFLPPHQTSYRHPELLPETPFYYRVRPYYGGTSGEVSVAVPADAPDLTASDPQWPNPRAVAHPGVTTAALRDDPPAAAPSGLAAKVMTADGIRFTWTDHATDEDGFLLEGKPEGAPEFTPVEVLDRDIGSCGLATLPRERSAAFRVRAFRYGALSTVAYQRTGRAPG
ncbi:fibronectin type III domain-containing protein [Amycolatopsis minnesotensis]|uniref:Fibronectin type III domain-containing protein n=1 Tax=Amycolatopsis minnesotensis TaxID=337894 RepID=A0ABN2QG57_9PSEU